MRARMTFVTFLAVCFCGSAPSSSLAQEVLFFVRHTSPPAFISMDEIKDDTPLSETGRKQAQDLAASLKDAGITAIYATDTLRTVQTAEPIANQLGLPIRQMPRKDVEGLVKRLRDEHARDRVLVVSHWKWLPPTLKALGHPADVKIERAAHDDLFVVVPVAGRPPVVTHLRY